MQHTTWRVSINVVVPTIKLPCHTVVQTMLKFSLAVRLNPSFHVLSRSHADFLAFPGNLSFVGGHKYQNGSMVFYEVEGRSMQLTCRVKDVFPVPRFDIDFCDHKDINCNNKQSFLNDLVRSTVNPNGLYNAEVLVVWGIF